MDIEKAVANPAGRKVRKRIGRGTGSGHGKTSGRGHKGQKSRSGSSIKPLSEGGQRPLFRRLPKRGFNNARFRKQYEIVNVAELSRFEAGDRVEAPALAEAGLIRSKTSSVKILGKGEIDRALTVVAAAFSAAARRKIEEAGGTAEVG